MITVVGYQHPCRYCSQFIPPNSSNCPFCSRVNPLGPLRCPQCRSPVRRSWKSCSSCGLGLELSCPQCRQQTFFGDYCDSCDARLTVTCSQENCGKTQPPLGKRCLACGEPLSIEGNSA